MNNNLGTHLQDQTAAYMVLNTLSEEQVSVTNEFVVSSPEQLMSYFSLNICLIICKNHVATF